MPNPMKPEIVRRAFLSVQVCVPADFTDDQVTDFANAQNPAGTQNGWVIRRAGDPNLRGDPERVVCAERDGCVHIVLDC